MADTDNRTQYSDDIIAANEPGGATDNQNKLSLAYHDNNGRHKWTGGSSVASASSISVPDNENYFVVTGTTTITGIAATTSGASAIDTGVVVKVKFSGALTLTHNGTSFIMPGGADASIAANDFAEFIHLGSGNWALLSQSMGSTLVDTGALSRTKFTYSTTTSILLDSAWYHHAGTTSQRVYWDSQLTFTFGPGGSNAGSTALGASEWHHLYIDDSAVVAAGTKLLTASEFLNSTTAPTYSQAKHSWYNGSDRYICSFLTTAGSVLEVFWHDGGDLIQYDNFFANASGIAPSTTWTTVTLTAPPTASKVYSNYHAAYSNAATWLDVRTKGSSGSTGLRVAAITSTGQQSATFASIETNTSQQVEVRFENATTNAVNVNTAGWYLPKGV